MANGVLAPCEKETILNTESNCDCDSEDKSKKKSARTKSEEQYQDTQVSSFTTEPFSFTLYAEFTFYLILTHFTFILYSPLELFEFVFYISLNQKLIVESLIFSLIGVFWYSNCHTFMFSDVLVFCLWRFKSYCFALYYSMDIYVVNL